MWAHLGDERHQLFLQIWSLAFSQASHFMKTGGSEGQTRVLIGEMDTGSKSPSWALISPRHYLHLVFCPDRRSGWISETSSWAPEAETTACIARPTSSQSQKIQLNNKSLILCKNLTDIQDGSYVTRHWNETISDSVVLNCAVIHKLSENNNEVSRIKNKWLQK